jgi:hypothetical protein
MRTVVPYWTNEKNHLAYDGNSRTLCGFPAGGESFGASKFFKAEDAKRCHFCLNVLISNGERSHVLRKEIKKLRAERRVKA